MSIAVVPGSFDPITLGHRDLVERAARLFEKVYAVAMVNVEKQYLFTPEERLELMRATLRGLPNVEVAFWDGMSFDYARQKGAAVLVKGVRSREDCAYELMIAANNRRFDSGLETVLLPAKEEWAEVSSLKAKQRCEQGLDLSRWVAPEVERALRNKLIKE